MPNRQKFAVKDKDFLLKMIGACETEEERGLVYLLSFTGMHISSAVTVTSKHLKKEGSRIYLRWNRPKTGKLLEAPISHEKVGVIKCFLDSPKRSIRWYQKVLRRIGEKAGYDEVSPMTFRHTRCISLWGEGRSLPEVCQVLGVTPDVAVRNYSKLRDDQLRGD